MSRTAVRMLLAMALLTALRLWLASGQLLSARSDSAHDDYLYLTLAQHIAGGRWLGPYTHMTLIKGPFYPLWIAASFVLGIPLQFSQHLLYIGACAVMVAAIRPLIGHPVALTVVYALLIFNPITFAITQVLREGISIALALLTVACAIALFVRGDGSLRVLAAWAVGGGAALSALWLTREEGIWILPALVFLLGATVVSLRRRRVGQFWQRLALFLTPFLLCGLSIVAISGINYRAYGVFAVTEVTAPEWLAAYGSLTRVEHDAWHRYFAVPRSVREQIYAVSPAFAELKTAIEGPAGQRWGVFGCRMLPGTCGDISDGWFLWLMRDVVADRGYYSTGPTALAYYRRLANEIDAACATGRLRCGPPRATMAPPWRSEYLALTVASMGQALDQVIRFKSISPISEPSVGAERHLLPFRMITRDRLAPTADLAGFGTYGVDRAKLAALAMIVEGYGRVAPILAATVVLALVVAPITALSTGAGRTLLVPFLALLVAFLSRIGFIAFVDATSFPSLIPQYLGPAHMLLTPLIFLACACLVATVRRGVPRELGGDRRGSVALAVPSDNSTPTDASGRIA